MTSDNVTSEPESEEADAEELTVAELLPSAILGRCVVRRLDELGIAHEGKVPDVVLEHYERRAARDRAATVDPDTARAVRVHERREGPPADAGEEIVVRVCRVMRYVEAELLSAVCQFDPYHSAHEGYAVIAEELDELWDEIKNNKLPGARARQRAEAVQVAAMGARFLLDIPAEEGDPS